MITLRHNRISLALHELRSGPGRPLLLLHGLGERSPRAVPPMLESAWSGPVHALDFTGHGDSTVPPGGGYTCEMLMADVDVALAHLGTSVVLGRGLGGYIALLIAGARPELVQGAILCDGPGLAGGGSGAASATIPAVDPSAPAPPDPWALVELARDPRPGDYASAFARQAAHLSGLDTPVSVCALARPEWLERVVEEPGVRETSLADALRSYAVPQIAATTPD